MKKIFIYMGLDGDLYFSTPKKLYQYACKFDDKAPAYSTFLKKLRDKDRTIQIFYNGADARVQYLDKYI